MIHLLVGVQGSGKTTFAKILSKKLDCEIVSSDEIRKQNPGILETKVWEKIYEVLAKCLNDSK